MLAAGKPSTEKERKAQFDRQTAEQYAAVGKFAVHFEHTCQELRTGIIWMLDRHGLTNQNVATLLLVRLTADSLQSIFRAILSETVDLTDDARRIVDDIMSRHQKLREERNEIIHNAWFIGWGSAQQTDFAEITAMKPQRTKEGGGFRVFKRTAEDILKKVGEADELTALINALWGWVVTDIQIENNFVLDEEGNARFKTSDAR